MSAPRRSDNESFVSYVFNVDYLLEDAVLWFQDNYSPDDVFTIDTLNDWALNNGFVREED